MKGEIRPRPTAALFLTTTIQSDILSNMKKITARQFQKEFGKIAANLREGQSLEVTMHGRALGQFTKKTRPIPMPDFVSMLEGAGSSRKNGEPGLPPF